MPITSPSVRLFVSYSHKDQKSLAELQILFKPAMDAGEILIWSDRELVAGDHWDPGIREALDNSEIYLFLISKYFLASDYIRSVEFRKAKEREERGFARIIPVILERCGWQEQPDLAGLQAVPVNGNPIRGGTGDRSERLEEVRQGVLEAARKQRKSARPGVRTLPAMPNIVYLCDRTDHDFAIGSALKGRKPKRPFVCLIPGESKESPHGYLQRLLEYSLPRELKLPDAMPIPRLYQLKWPPVRTRERIRTDLLQYLALGCGMQADQLPGFLTSHPLPVVVHSKLEVKDWPGTGEQLIRGYLDFWNDWTEIPETQVLVACLLIEFEGEAPPADRAAMEQFVAALNFEEYANLSGVRLDPLNPVPVDEAEQFAFEPAVQRYWDTVRQHDTWVDGIRSIYGPRKTMSMSELAPGLKALLEIFPRAGDARP